MEYRGYTVTQSSYNNHIMITKNGKMIIHANFENKLDEKGLKILADDLLLIAENANVYIKNRNASNEEN